MRPSRPRALAEGIANRAGALGAWVLRPAAFPLRFLGLVDFGRRLASLAERLCKPASRGATAAIRAHDPLCILGGLGGPSGWASPCCCARARRSSGPGCTTGNRVSRSGHAGGVLGFLLGPLSMKWLGFAGSGVLWIALAVVSISLTFRFLMAPTGRRDRRPTGCLAGSPGRAHRDGRRRAIGRAGLARARRPGRGRTPVARGARADRHRGARG